ncbi:hypothetical protein ADL12_32725 [Streptomyces regalis]|uniref:PPM-type phosphatase domain-containing protein n=1 Tax=Streptomyces regalis TaxID=68262 RepID=A0A101JG20_9ACTN|nr:hypothetical protein ADL12_32725 [Streptomyces regalis]
MRMRSGGEGGRTGAAGRGAAVGGGGEGGAVERGLACVADGCGGACVAAALRSSQVPEQRARTVTAAMAQLPTLRRLLRRLLW